MIASRLKPSRIVTTLVLMLGLVLTGCKKETPTTQQPSEPQTTAQDQADKEKEFLSDPDVVTCELEEITIEGLDIPENSRPSFVRRMEREDRKVLKRAELTLADRPLKVLIGKRLEREFFLYDVDKGLGPYWWGSWSLHSYHKIGDGFLEFMLVEDGTKIAARPYKGELGIVKVGKGGRELEKIEFNGSVHQTGSVAAPIGEIEERSPSYVTECEVPVGDYTAYIMHVKYDDLSITISNNYHTNAQGQSDGKKTVYGMQVRKDEPFVLDFSNEPVVVFDQPSKSKTSFARGDKIMFAAVLVDPELDVMIRGLDDTAVQEEKTTSSGSTYKRPKSLDPKVVITRADGEIVAEGVMPFG